MIHGNPPAWEKMLFILAGSVLYAVGMNLSITPLGLFSGGGVGLAQLFILF